MWCPCFNSKFDDCLNTNEFDTNLFNNEFDHAIRLALSIHANNHRRSNKSAEFIGEVESLTTNKQLCDHAL